MNHGEFERFLAKIAPRRIFRAGELEGWRRQDITAMVICRDGSPLGRDQYDMDRSRLGFKSLDLGREYLKVFREQEDVRRIGVSLRDWDLYWTIRGVVERGDLCSNVNHSRPFVALLTEQGAYRRRTSSGVVWMLPV